MMLNCSSRRSKPISLTRLEEEALALTSESTPASDASLQTKHADLARPHLTRPPASRKAESMGPLLVETKLHHPRLPSTLVTRGRLLQALDRVLEHRLTLLSTSAGSG